MCISVHVNCTSISSQIIVTFAFGFGEALSTGGSGAFLCGVITLSTGFVSNRFCSLDGFTFKEAAKQEDKLARDLIGRKLVRDLIARAMQSQDDPYSVEMQGWLTDILKKYGNVHYNSLMIM